MTGKLGGALVDPAFSLDKSPMQNAMLAMIWLIGHSLGRPGWNFAR
jgi:hypothetical protein